MSIWDTIKGNWAKNKGSNAAARERLGASEIDELDMLNFAGAGSTDKVINISRGLVPKLENIVQQLTGIRERRKAIELSYYKTNQAHKFAMEELKLAGHKPTVLTDLASEGLSESEQILKVGGKKVYDTLRMLTDTFNNTKLDMSTLDAEVLELTNKWRSLRDLLHKTKEREANLTPK